MPTAIPFPPSYFLDPSGRYFDEQASLNVAATLTRQVVLSVTVPLRQAAILLGVGIDAGQLEGWVWGSWDLEVNAGTDPAFHDVQSMIARLLEPMPLYRVCKGGTSIRLLVSNLNSTEGFQYMARVVGFFLDETKLVSSEGADLGGGH